MALLAFQSGADIFFFSQYEVVRQHVKSEYTYLPAYFPGGTLTSLQRRLLATIDC